MIPFSLSLSLPPPSLSPCSLSLSALLSITPLFTLSLYFRYLPDSSLFEERKKQRQQAETERERERKRVKWREAEKYVGVNVPIILPFLFSFSLFTNARSLSLSHFPSLLHTSLLFLFASRSLPDSVSLSGLLHSFSSPFERKRERAHRNKESKRQRGR